MFAEHNPAINAYTQQSHEHMRECVMMVALSIQQSWDSVGTQLADWRSKGARSRFVWGNKRKTHDYMRKYGKRVYNELMAADSDAERMLAALQIPGIGLPKAGFVCQLAFGTVGCIDVHNIRRMNVAPSLLTVSMSAKPDTIAKRVQAYLDVCDYDGSERLWNDWCQLIATKYPAKWPSAHAVSQAHYTYLTGE